LKRRRGGYSNQKREREREREGEGRERERERACALGLVASGLQHAPNLNNGAEEWKKVRKKEASS